MASEGTDENINSISSPSLSRVTPDLKAGCLIPASWLNWHYLDLKVYFCLTLRGSWAPLIKLLEDWPAIRLWFLAVASALADKVFCCWVVFFSPSRTLAMNCLTLITLQIPSWLFDSPIHLSVSGNFPRAVLYCHFPVYHCSLEPYILMHKTGSLRSRPGASSSLTTQFICQQHPASGLLFQPLLVASGPSIISTEQYPNNALLHRRQLEKTHSLSLGSLQWRPKRYWMAI